MKQSTLHITILIFLIFGGILLAPRHLNAEGVRIVPQSITVRNDSLHLFLQMDLNSVRVNTVTAVFFTPMLIGRQHQQLELPPVIITGNLRYHYERRERALTATQQIPVTPYLVLLDSRKTVSKLVRYKVTVPYTSWMQDAALLLRQDMKDCCDLQILGVDTLTRKLALVSGVTRNELMDGNTVASSLPPRARRIWNIDQSIQDLDLYASMVSFLVPDPGVYGKRRSERMILYFDYPVGKDDIYPDYKNNREEIYKIDSILRPLLENHFSTVERIEISGYSSPEGPYGDNERLAKARSTLFSNYIRNTYAIPRNLIDVSSVAEDWDGLAGLLQQEKPAYKDVVLDVIRRYGIFQGREKQLMDLQGGVPYQDMLRRLFPRLRRIEVVVQYNIRKVESREAAELIYTHPDLLNLEEIYGVARYYRPGTDQYREVYEIAAYRYPDDVVANVNAASAVMLTGDLQSAWNYLRKVEDDPRAWNNFGVLCLMEGDPEGAISWFRKAVGVDPRKARNNLETARQLIIDNE